MTDINPAKPRILFIDDDTLNAHAFAKRLATFGFFVDVLNSAKSAQSAIEKNPYDLVLLDIVMPEMDGLTLLKQIRAHRSSDDLPVIMVTALDKGENIYEAFEQGANDYIAKPLHIDTAVARINGQLNASRLRQANMNLKQMEAIAAMVITYHHEINNPLSILKNELQNFEQEHGLAAQKLEKVYKSITRISQTLEKIKKLGDKNEVSFQPYAKDSKMIKINE